MRQLFFTQTAFSVNAQNPCQPFNISVLAFFLLWRSWGVLQGLPLNAPEMS